ncbi:MAG TPA: PqqD family protein [Vicinamibacterales bacterium]|nr:PqqD family protein [Vicinamibacterales bacterium]
MPDELLVYDRDRQKAHCLNRTAGLVWRNCDGTRSAAEIAVLLQAELHPEADEALVALAVSDLDRAHLLEKPAAGTHTDGGWSRREMVRNVGLAVLAPVVLSVAAPTVAQASSALRAGEGGGGEKPDPGKKKGKGGTKRKDAARRNSSSVK